MSESKPHIRLDDLALDWARIEEWCSRTSGRAIYGPVLARVEEAGRALEAERDRLVEQLEAVQQERSLAGIRIRELEETLRTYSSTPKTRVGGQSSRSLDGND